MDKICKRCGKKRWHHYNHEFCCACEREIKRKKIQQEFQDATFMGEQPDTWSDEYIICPYCGQAIDPDDESIPEIYEEGWHYADCSDCGKRFTIDTIVSYSWETEKGDENG